jgi:peptide/nickel transport system substrate-binding protein
MYVASVVREAIYDGPIDTRSFDFQPVILEKLPSLADGDAVLEPVAVQAGDLVLDNQGDVVPLAQGVVVRPTGCRHPECAMTYDGGPLEMEQLSATFRLLPGLRWSDGAPLTAADSVFSFQVAQGATVQFASGPEPAGQYGLVPAREVDPTPRTASYTALDERTVQWVGLPGFLDPYYRTNFYTPLPEHQLGHLSADRLAEAPESARTPLGWGPYILKQWVPGQRIVTERNPHYFRAAEGLPYFERLVFRFTGQQVERNLADLQAGHCDLLTLDTGLGAQLDQVREVEAGGAIRLYPSIATPWEHLSFGIKPAPGYDRPDYFEDVRLRQAIAHCVDRQQIVDQVYHGLTIVPDVYVPPSHPLYPDDGLGRYTFDPEVGRALLEEAGWRDGDGDGVREAHGLAGIPDGTRLELHYETTTSETRAQVAALIAEDLAICGMAVSVIQTPQGEFFAGDPPGPVFGRRFDLVQFAWLSGAMPPCKLFLSSEIPSEANGWTGENITGYANPAYDAACRAALGTLPGSEEYTTSHQEAMRLFFQDLPALPLAMRFNLSAARPDLRGLVVDPTNMAETWNLEEFRLEP